ncbi:hypothetical protein [Kordiimonas aquimaris]|uniref:hypothetical protein n=1 Tax=Kordiimonas aquimaris TaxID=707591 RepID=UPI0021D29442|nr:hypothetical protein [Kordiimonas aquimaris]
MTTYTRTVTQFVLKVGKTESAIEARILAQSGIDIGLLHAFEEPYASVSASAKVVDMDEGRVFIRYESERGKIDLNAAPVEMITQSLKLLELDTVVQQQLIQTIRSRRSRTIKTPSIAELFTSVDIDHNTFEIACRIYTVFSDLHYVDTRKAHPVLAQWLRVQNQSGWTSTASGGAFRILSTGQSKSGSEHTLAAIFQPQPLQKPPYRLARRQILNYP